MGAKSAFEGFDFEGLWDDSEYSLQYVEPAPSDELIASIEEELGGFRLPAAYVELARMRNGGALKRNRHPMDEPTGWAEDHIAISNLYAIGRTSFYSLCGAVGSKFMEEEWGYPPIGVCIANTPTGGHEMIVLDYRECGKQGEPRVVYVDQEDDYSITFVAPDFATFVRGLLMRTNTILPRRTVTKLSQRWRAARFPRSCCARWKRPAPACRMASPCCGRWRGRSSMRRVTSRCTPTSVPISCMT